MKILSTILENIFLENNKKNIVVIYPGRFQPFHNGHFKVFNEIKKKFSGISVFVAPSNPLKIADKSKNQLSYNEKIKLVKTYLSNVLVVPSGTSTYNIGAHLKSLGVSEEEMERYIVVFAVGNKDEKRLKNNKNFIKFKNIDDLKVPSLVVKNDKKIWSAYVYTLSQDESTIKLTDVGFSFDDIEKIGISNNEISGTNVRKIFLFDKENRTKFSNKLINTKSINIYSKYI